MKAIVLLSGRICSGKTELAEALRREFGFTIFKSSQTVAAHAKQRQLPPTRESLQELGDHLDDETDGEWVLTGMREAIDTNCNFVVVDAVRISKQIQKFRTSYPVSVFHVHLTAPEEVLRARFEGRKHRVAEKDGGLTYIVAARNATEASVDSLEVDADLTVNTHHSDTQDTFVRVAGALRLFAPPRGRFVDVLVGGQYGSEGKGQVAAHLARKYDVLVRVGGPNAGHSVKSESGRFVYHHLPSGCRDTKSEVLIGPGAVIHVEELLHEIRQCDITPGRLHIDPNAFIITSDDREREARVHVKQIGSTGSGAGVATARKILREDDGRSLAKNCPALAAFIGETFERLEKAYALHKRIFLEGTQGSALSLHHGRYPHVTSRDTNVAGCLSEAGISPSRVGRVIMVVRTYPIRVANPDGGQATSGYLKGEINFREVASRAGLDGEELVAAEKTSRTGRDRRVGEFDWELFRRSCALNAPTDIALTFVDYISAKNRHAHRFEQLTGDTVRLIEELQRVSHAPVSLISTRFGERGIIDRRDWW